MKKTGTKPRTVEPNTISLDDVARGLERAGYDVVRPQADCVLALKAEHVSRELIVDERGHAKAKISRSMGEASREGFTIGSAAVQVVVENLQTTTVLFQLRRDTDLERLLELIEKL